MRCISWLGSSVGVIRSRTTEWCPAAGAHIAEFPSRPCDPDRSWPGASSCRSLVPLAGTQSTTLPSRKMVIVSAIRAISGSRWLTYSNAAPSVLSPDITSKSLSISGPVSAAVGSSKMNSFPSIAIPRAIMTVCWMAGRWVRRGDLESMWTPSLPRSSSACRSRDLWRTNGPTLGKEPRIMFSATLRSSAKVNSCGTVLIPRRRAWAGDRSACSTPASRTFLVRGMNTCNDF